MKKDSTWFLVKVIALVIALAAVFWAKSSLQQTAKSPASDPAAPIPAKVDFGK